MNLPQLRPYCVHWTKAEVELLREMVEDATLNRREMAAQLHRTQNATDKKMAKMGLVYKHKHKNENPFWEATKHPANDKDLRHKNNTEVNYG